MTMQHLSGMRRPAVWLLLLACGSPCAFATIQCDSLSTLQDYLNQGSIGCRLGDKVLSNFAFVFTGGTSSGTAQLPLVPAAGNVTISTALAGGSAAMPDWVSLTFDFNSMASVAANQTMDLKIQYLVATAPLASYAASIFGVDTASAGARRTQTTTTSRAYLTSSTCLGAAFDVAGLTPTGSCLDGETRVVGTLLGADYGKVAADPNVVANQRTITGSLGSAEDSLDQNAIGVYNYIQLIGGSTDLPAGQSQSAVSTFTNRFYEDYEFVPTPEPVPLLLIGSGLIILGVGGRRKLSS